VSATKELDDLMASISDLDIIEVKSYRTDISLETVKSVFYYSLMSLWISVHNSNLYTLFRVLPGHGKSWNLGRPFSRPGKSWKMMIMSWNFYYCTEQFCKSDTTSFIKSNYEP